MLSPAGRGQQLRHLPAAAQALPGPLPRRRQHPRHVRHLQVRVRRLELSTKLLESFHKSKCPSSGFFPLPQVQQGGHRHQPPRRLQRGHGARRGAAAVVRDGAGKEMLSNIFSFLVHLI